MPDQSDSNAETGDPQTDLGASDQRFHLSVRRMKVIDPLDGNA